MPSVQQLIEKAKRPPTLPNWVRLNHRQRSVMAQSVRAFVLNSPKHSLGKVNAIIADYVTMKTSVETAHSSINKIKNGLVRRLGHEILYAILPWLDTEKIEGIQVFHDFSAPFPIGRGIVVPVSPTFVFNCDGKLTPVFVIGWTTDPLTSFQNSLLATMIYKAILTQEGFIGSDARIIFVPRIRGVKSGRYVKSWLVSKCQLLSDSELADQFDRFNLALDDVVAVLEAMAARGEL